ncbi:1-aminocyclopropane-1-carboxylate oxidase homolog 4-like [Juglans regia]|uniref:1-aminocyclopropane-1-carboxylate oxidase homolog 4-like n=1 Tax=Juglans regia TaxID=51240 RepID=A0A6P9E7J3_JUGRE|nr:1-aminocyclopropane-1-carboxylate oxidase homolog 4-like [Juglans regia]
MVLLVSEDDSRESDAECVLSPAQVRVNGLHPIRVFQLLHFSVHPFAFRASPALGVSGFARVSCSIQPRFFQDADSCHHTAQHRSHAALHVSLVCVLRPEGAAASWGGDHSRKPRLDSKRTGKYVGTLITSLFSLISEALGLEKDFSQKRLGDPPELRTQANYYPPCPNPDLTLGLAIHTDLPALTVLQQSAEVTGLQVLKDGEWVAVDPIPNAFVINLGDQMQFGLWGISIFNYG